MTDRMQSTLRNTRIGLGLAVCGLVVLSATIYVLRQENARNLRDIEGLAVRAAILERQKATLSFGWRAAKHDADRWRVEARRTKEMREHAEAHLLVPVNGITKYRMLTWEWERGYLKAENADLKARLAQAEARKSKGKE